MPFSLIPDRVYRSIFEITGAKLAAQGIVLEDTPQGVKWHRA